MSSGSWELLLRRTHQAGATFYTIRTGRVMVRWRRYSTTPSTSLLVRTASGHEPLGVPQRRQCPQHGGDSGIRGVVQARDFEGLGFRILACRPTCMTVATSRVGALPRWGALGW